MGRLTAHAERDSQQMVLDVSFAQKVLDHQEITRDVLLWNVTQIKSIDQT